MAVTDQQFLDHSNQNNAEFANRLVQLKGTVDPSAGGGVPALQGSLYAKTDVSPYIRYDKTGPLDTDWTLFASGFGSPTVYGSGTVLKFDKHYIHGNTSAETGNVTFDLAGALLGNVLGMRHNNAVEPTYGAPGVVKIEGDYVSNIDNYLYFHYWSATRILLKISQV